ncbi:hypothetical protein [Tissierella sp. Yu-01]|uniref:hypothetical protein n=1 Tax=Tissierella sp. Yu-01 TaxID=3035694 RepID=UPI00240D58BD|nr:hypothetical protein [Tissierella sp. Yu-01]WFA10153.1 hypothetical protein P3962_06275 [Tissierella sp. Yu-01]
MKSNGLILASIVILIFFPIGGLIMLITIFFRHNEMDSKINIYNEESNLEKKNSYFFPEIDVDKESDIIALDDSLELSNLKYRRETVLDILKKDVDKYSDFFKKALKNDDTETTHYVATSILNTKMELDSALILASYKYKKDSTNLHDIKVYLEILSKQLKMPYLDKQLKDNLIKEKSKILCDLVESDFELDQEYIIRLINLLIDSENYVDAKYYCYLFMKDYPDTEEKLTTLLKCFFIFKDNKRFHETLKKMKNDFMYSKKVIDYLNFWIGGNL